MREPIDKKALSVGFIVNDDDRTHSTGMWSAANEPNREPTDTHKLLKLWER